MPVKRMRRRMLGAVLGWGAGAFVAVSVGVIAMSSITAGFATAAEGEPIGVVEMPPPTSHVRTPGVAPQPSATTGKPGASRPAPAPSRSRAGNRPSADPTPRTNDHEQRLLTSRGGNVLARCDDHDVYLVLWSPAPGYRTRSMLRGPAPTAMISFSDDHTLVTMTVQCENDAPFATTNTRTVDGHDT